MSKLLYRREGTGKTKPSDVPKITNQVSSRAVNRLYSYIIYLRTDGWIEENSDILTQSRSSA